MTWIKPPDTILRFSLHQRMQHWVAAAIGAALVISAVVSPFAQGAWPGRIHEYTGLGGAGLLLYHLLALAAIGIRHDLPMHQVAFVPSNSSQDGKYATEERRDYLNLLAWSFLLVITGIFLRWPGSLGLPGIRAYTWLRVIHAGFGAVMVIHLLVVHINERWFRAPATFRKAILYGTVPLQDAEKRPGWICELVAEGILVHMPSDKPHEERKESERVRELLEEGNRMVRDEDLEGAVGAFGEALALFPGYSQAMFNLGVARMKQGRMDLAAEQFRRFVEADPFNPMAERAKTLIDDIDRMRKEGPP